MTAGTCNSNDNGYCNSNDNGYCNGKFRSPLIANPGQLADRKSGTPRLKTWRPGVQEKDRLN
jgi:hypothetical protein